MFGKKKSPREPWTPVDDGRGAPLLPSTATDREINDFSSGFCHVLAMELNARYGWKLRALGTPSDEFSIRPFKTLGFPRHVYCLNDDGLPVDVHGVFADEAAIQRYYAHQHSHDAAMTSCDITFDEIRESLPEYGYVQPLQEELKFVRLTADELAHDELRLTAPVSA